MSKTGAALVKTEGGEWVVGHGTRIPENLDGGRHGTEIFRKKFRTTLGCANIPEKTFSSDSSIPSRAQFHKLICFILFREVVTKN